MKTATKKRIEQLEVLLDWEREGDRLPKTTELFNRQIAETLFLRELKKRLWLVEALGETEEGNISTIKILIKHETLVQLGLTILDAVKQTEKRFIDSE